MTTNRTNDGNEGPKQPKECDAASTTGSFAADLTVSAPSFPVGQVSNLSYFPVELAPTEHLAQRVPPGLVENGKAIGDFEIVALLGRGAAGAVYLARQRSLDRRVALKITRNIGGEARTMASLEHPHIVQVFSETIDAAGDTRLLCMQYVPGATLADVLARLRKLPRSQLSGAALIAAIDAAGHGEPALDNDGLRDRQYLSSADYVSAVCWIVARLAEALHFAHQRGVLHRDIKPANILVNPYGRPLLADFSLSFASFGNRDDQDELFGGTLAYMAPEHLDAFNPETAATPEVVNERSDVYSLGVVLYEMLALELPHATSNVKQLDGAALKALEAARRTPPEPLRARLPEISFALDHAIGRCLAGDPADRFQNAGQLAASLDGCRLLEAARRRLPPPGPFIHLAERFPLAAAIPLSFLPHVLGNLFTPAYSFLVLSGRLPPEQLLGVVWISAIYGGFMFPLMAGWVLLRYTWAARVWMRLRRGEPLRADEVDRARGRLLTIPMMSVAMSLAAWLPLLAYVPAGLQFFGTGMTWYEFAHFAVSILLSLLIATTYSFFMLQYLVTRLFYPLAWADAASLVAVARKELAPIGRRVRWFQIGAGLVPLLGAILIVSVGPEAFQAGSYLAFRLLIVALIVLGMAGMPYAIHVGGLILRAIEALTGRDGVA